MTLVAAGDPLPHVHDLPDIPTEPTRKFVGQWIIEHEKQINAVAICDSCGKTFVSREDPEGWGRRVYWAPLRWWHFKARQKLRERVSR